MFDRFRTRDGRGGSGRRKGTAARKAARCQLVMESLEDRTLLSAAFNAPQAFDVPGGPTDVATGQFEGTKAPLDVVTADADGTVSVLLGNGDGTLQFPINIHIGGGFDSVAVGDFLGNGLQDIVAGNTNGTVSVLLSNGNGTFKAPEKLSLGATPEGVAVGDFLGNGELDIVTANSNGTVTALLGNGDGTFGQPITSRIGGRFTSVAVGDLNGDGKPDLVVGTGSGLDSLLGKGDGTFQLKSKITFFVDPKVDPSLTIPVTSVALGDFRGDGKLDIVANASGEADLLLGKGDGTFQPRVVLNGGEWGTASFVVGNFNGDGTLDIATSVDAGPFGGGPSLNVLLGKGDGTFQAPRTSTIGEAGNALAIGDFNGDGKLDLALAASGVDNVSVVLGNGDGTFATNPGIPVNTGLPNAIAAGDFTGSGKTDLVTTGFAGGAAVLLNNGDGTFRAGPTLSIDGTPIAVVVGAFTNDGHQDIAVATEGGEVEVFLGNGNGTFQAPRVFNFGNDHSIRAMVAGDFNHDGHLDLAVSYLLGFGGAEPSDLTVLLGKGDGTFTRGQTVMLGTDAEGLAVADLTGNGKLDLVTTTFLPTGERDVKVLLGNSDGTFQKPIEVTPGTRATFVGVGDFTGDGKPDLVLVDYFNDAVSILPGNGNGTFQKPITFSFPDKGTLLGGPAVGDFFEDGKLSVAVTTGLGTVSILRGNGDGTFQAPLNFIVDFHGEQPSTLIAADFNGDGKLDLAATNALTDDVSVLLNTTTPLGTTNPIATTTTLTADVTTAVFGQPVTLSATVRSSAGTPTGSVTFFDGSIVLGVVAVDPNGQAILTVPFSVGLQSLTASFAGIGAFTDSTSAALSETVKKDATKISLSVDQVAQSIEFITATLNPAAPGAGVPTGTAVIRDGNTIVGTATLDNGQVFFLLEGLTPGTHKFTISYRGDTDFLASTASIVVNIP
jgi:hypothetical protein